MAEIENNPRIQTLKRMLAVAKRLVENESSEIFELAHYIADNILNKACMLLGIEKNGEPSIYKYPQEKQRVKDFDVLYKTILEKYFPDVPSYNDIIRDYHRNRNSYNHDILSLDLSIRKPIAMSYINYVEKILKKVGYLENETIKPSSLISNTSLTDLDSSHIRQLAQKFKRLYDRLASKNPENVIIDIKTLVEDIGAIELGRILKLAYTPESKERIMLIQHNKWNLSIKTGPSGHVRLIKYLNGNSKTYDFEFPNQDEYLLTEFLDLIRERFKEHGII